jgi:F1F0 ATPase subunit 2
MSLLGSLGLSCLAGAALGWVYFLGLWATVRRIPGQRHPGLWMALGLLARFVLLLAVFVFAVRRGGWPALAAALVGFLVARTVVVRRTGVPAIEPEGRA